MKLAISGSTGLVGSALCQRLRALGHEIVSVVRVSQTPEPASSLAPSEIAWDPLTGLLRPEAFNEVDALVHLAGKSIASGRWTNALKRQIRDSRVTATEILAEQLSRIESPPRTVISASAIGIYGDCGSAWVDEESPVGEGFLADVARAWEAACDPLREAGLRVVHPRFGIVLSKEGGALRTMLPLFRSMVGGRLGSGNQFWSWIALEDCVSALVWLLEHAELSGAFNLVAPEVLTNSEFTQELAAVLSKPAAVPAPAFALRLALGEMADALLLASCRVSSARLAKTGFQFQFPNLQPFLEHELG